MKNGDLQRKKDDVYCLMDEIDDHCFRSKNASGISRRKVKRVVCMQQVFVKFDDVDQVRNFVNAVNSVDANFELGSGRRVVDPKSILGVFALDLARPQRLICDSDDSSMLDKISPYLLRERVC